MAKPPFNYKSENLDEKEIDKILSKRRCDVIVARIPAAHFEFTPEEKKEFLKRYPSEKKIKPAGPFDMIIRHLTALINNKNIQENHQRKYTIDRDFYRAMQEGARPPTGGEKMFYEYIVRDQVYDLVKYIFDIRGGCLDNITLVKCFDLTAQVWNEKRNGSMTVDRVKDLYWRYWRSGKQP